MPGDTRQGTACPRCGRALGARTTCFACGWRSAALVPPSDRPRWTDADAGVESDGGPERRPPDTGSGRSGERCAPERANGDGRPEPESRSEDDRARQEPTGGGERDRADRRPSPTDATRTSSAEQAKQSLVTGKVDQISPTREIESKAYGALFLYTVVAVFTWTVYLAVFFAYTCIRLLLALTVKSIGGALPALPSPAKSLGTMREKIAPRNVPLQTFRVLTTDGGPTRSVECLLRGDQHGASIALGDRVEVTGKFDDGSMGHLFVAKRVRNLDTGAVTTARERKPFG